MECAAAGWGEPLDDFTRQEFIEEKAFSGYKS